MIDRQSIFIDEKIKIIIHLPKESTCLMQPSPKFQYNSEKLKNNNKFHMEVKKTQVRRTILNQNHKTVTGITTHW